MSGVRKVLRRWAYSAGFIESELDAAVDRVYSAVARELAEKARRPLTQVECMDIQSGVPLREVLARRIDPEVP